MKQHESECDSSNIESGGDVDISSDCGPCVNQRIWLIEFEINRVGRGCAVCKATNPKEAIMLLRTSGFYNGTPQVYDVIRVEEIVESPCNGLIAEQIVTLDT